MQPRRYALQQSSTYTSCKPAPPNYPLRDPIYQLVETIMPLVEVHWGVLEEPRRQGSDRWGEICKESILQPMVPQYGLVLRDLSITVAYIHICYLHEPYESQWLVLQPPHQVIKGIKKNMLQLTGLLYASGPKLKHCRSDTEGLRHRI